MSANANVYAGVWPDGTPSLGTLDLTYIKPIPDASHYWSSRQLTSGELLTWTDRVSGAPLAAASSPQSPTVYAGARKVVRFDGTSDRVGVRMDLSGPRTMAIVAQITHPGPGRSLTYGVDGGTFWNIYQGSNGNWGFTAGRQLLSTKPADSLRHVFLVVSNGANSVLRIDDEEWAGDAGSTPAPGFRIGSNASAYFGVDVEAVVVLPFAADLARRNSLVGALKTQYKL